MKNINVKKSRKDVSLESLTKNLIESPQLNRNPELLETTILAVNRGQKNKAKSRDVRRMIRKTIKQTNKSEQATNNRFDNSSPKHISFLLKDSIPETKWLVDRLIPYGCTTVISGESRSFKTWILLHLAKQISEGLLIFNKFPAIKQSVLLVEEDDKPRAIKDRVTILGFNKDNNFYTWINSGFKVEKDMDQLILFVKKNKIGVVIFDCLLRIYDGDENSSRDIEKLFRQIQRLTNLDVTVIITHHHRKSQVGFTDRSPMRGSSDILNSPDCHLQITRKGKNKIRIIQQKVRASEEIQPFDVVVKSDNDRSFELLFTEFQTQSDEDFFNKQELAEEQILLLLNEVELIDRQELIKTLKQQNDIGQNVSDKAIKNLIANRKVTVKTGAKGKKSIQLLI